MIFYLGSSRRIILLPDNTEHTPAPTTSVPNFFNPLTTTNVFTSHAQPLCCLIAASVIQLTDVLYPLLRNYHCNCIVAAKSENASAASVANWYIYIPDFTNLVYFLDRLVGEIMVWYMSLNLVYFYAFW